MARQLLECGEPPSRDVFAGIKTFTRTLWLLTLFSYYRKLVVFIIKSFVCM